MNDDIKFMKMAIELSKNSEYPYGAVIVRNGKVIGRSDADTNVLLTGSTVKLQLKQANGDYTDYIPNDGGGLVRTVTSGDDKRRGRVRIGSPVSANLWRCATEASPFRPRFHYQLMECLDTSLRNRNFAIDSDNNRTSVLQEIKEYLNEYYYQQLSINDLGAMTQFSPPYLNRLFRERYQMSLHDYLSQLRLSHAKFLLKKDPNMPVGKVAEAVGIPDQRYFSRCFRKEFGITPGEYRARAAELP